jgi:cytoskeletal protein CcmA (bactofilin family)
MIMADETQATIIAADAHFKGELSFDRSCRILGRFEGTLTAKGQLHIAEGASCKAQIDAANITVDGNVEGNITAKEKIELNAKARVNGDVVAARLIVAEGASFSGHVSVGADAARGPSRSSADLKPTVTASEPAKPAMAHR